MIGRREFLRGTLGGAAWLAGPRPARARLRLPPPGGSGVEHIVVVTMENRSFDHVLGWHPTADGRQAGLDYADAGGVRHATYPLAPDYAGCGHPDPDHSWDGGRVQYAGGAMDGFLRSGASDVLAIGYYGEADRPFASALARHYTVCDRYFCSILGPTLPNRLFLHCAQTDRIDNTIALARIPPIWDRLADVGVTARYYYSNLPFLGLWGRRYRSISRRYDDFLADAAAGALPAVAFVDPRFTVGDSAGNDDHPHADVRAGDRFLAEVFGAVSGGPAWGSTVLVVTYDEWGGFFDHVPPPRAVAPNNIDPDNVRGRARLGFRVPTIVASPFTRGLPESPRVGHLVFDHTSVLKLIEWRWQVPPLTLRDASASIASLVRLLDLEHPAVEVPDLPVPPAPPAVPCGSGERARAAIPAAGPSTDSPWSDLAASPLLDGWAVDLD